MMTMGGAKMDEFFALARHRAEWNLAERNADV